MRNSLTAVMDVATNKVEKFSYKPWGMRRKPANWSENFVTDYTSRFSRGYCMHEHSSVYGDDGITMGHFSNVNTNDEVVGGGQNLYRQNIVALICTNMDISIKDATMDHFIYHILVFKVY